MSLKYEPASEPLHPLLLTRILVQTDALVVILAQTHTPYSSPMSRDLW